MENQKKTFPLGRLLGVIVDIKGVHIISNFEVIDIIDDSNPYFSLLGIAWELDNMVIISMKKRQMIFERNNM